VEFESLNHDINQDISQQQVRVGCTYYMNIFIELTFSWIYVEDYSMLKISEMLDPDLNQIKTNSKQNAHSLGDWQQPNQSIVPVLIYDISVSNK